MICHQYRVQAVIDTKVVSPSRNQSRVSLTVSVNQQDTIIWRSSVAE